MAALESERMEDIHMERFHSTPWALFRELAQAVLERLPRERALSQWTKRRLEHAAALDAA